MAGRAWRRGDFSACKHSGVWISMVFVLLRPGFSQLSA